MYKILIYEEDPDIQDSRKSFFEYHESMVNYFINQKVNDFQFSITCKTEEEKAKEEEKLRKALPDGWCYLVRKVANE